VGEVNILLSIQSQSVSVVFWLGAALFFLLTLAAGVRRSLRYLLPAVPIATIGLVVLLGRWDGVRSLVDWLAAPERMLLLLSIVLTLALVFYRTWTRPWFAGSLLLAFSVAYFASCFDRNFFLVVSKPDNVPITMLIFLVGFCLWLALRQAAMNDRRAERGEPIPDACRRETVLTWPNLVYIELVAAVLCLVLLIVWSLLVRAPLEGPADPATVPNPSKAPWYFVGLQELLVYFDPWLAGVVLPGAIIFGLCALPYIDRNPYGTGSYTFKERPFAITIFIIGFVLLWVALIVIGTFLRGPNWTFFGPFELWDPHRPAALTNVNLSELFWLRWLGTTLPTLESAGSWHPLVREAPGLVLLAGYFLLIPRVCRATIFRTAYARMGPARYGVMMVLLTLMALVPIKMLLRWLFNLKYIVALTEWSFNI